MITCIDTPRIRHSRELRAAAAARRAGRRWRLKGAWGQVATGHMIRRPNEDGCGLGKPSSIERLTDDRRSALCEDLVDDHGGILAGSVQEGRLARAKESHTHEEQARGDGACAL
jgi:hypothetical protein